MGKRRGRNPAEWETANTLAAAIERLYEAFRYYPLRPEIPYCTHCITPEQAQRIYIRPLRELMPDDLMSYASSAMTTWGTVGDFKHFFPRIFELAVHNYSFVPDLDMLGSQLDYAGWREWPESEQQAVEDVLMMVLWEGLW
jgi:hypothetical protein